MTTYDFSPLFRSSVGFDRLARLMDASLQAKDTTSGYPPYNIAVIGEDHYRIMMAVAGYTEDNLSIEVQDQTLIVKGTSAKEDEDVEYLHHGIAERDFVRKFQLAEFVKVADAHLVNGMLTIDLERVVPEELKPRTIKIETSEPKSLASKAKKLLEGGSDKKAA